MDMDNNGPKWTGMDRNGECSFGIIFKLTRKG